MLLLPLNLATPFVVSGRVTTLNLHVEIKAQTYCFHRFRQVNLSNYIDSDILARPSGLLVKEKL